MGVTPIAPAEMGATPIHGVAWWGGARRRCPGRADGPRMAWSTSAHAALTLSVSGATRRLPPDWRNRRVVEIKTKGEIDAIRAAGQVVAETLDTVRVHASAGMRLSELDDVARAVLALAGAQSPFLGYKPAFAPVPF